METAQVRGTIMDEKHEVFTAVAVPPSAELRIHYSHSDDSNLYNWKNVTGNILRPLQAATCKCGLPPIQLLHCEFGINGREIVKVGRARWYYRQRVSLGFLFIGCWSFILSVRLERTPFSIIRTSLTITHFSRLDSKPIHSPPLRFPLIPTSPATPPPSGTFRKHRCGISLGRSQYAKAGVWQVFLTKGNLRSDTGGKLIPYPGWWCVGTKDEKSTGIETKKEKNQRSVGRSKAAGWKRTQIKEFAISHCGSSDKATGHQRADPGHPNRWRCIQ